MKPLRTSPEGANDILLYLRGAPCQQACASVERRADTRLLRHGSTAQCADRAKEDRSREYTTGRKESLEADCAITTCCIRRILTPYPLPTGSTLHFRRGTYTLRSARRAPLSPASKPYMHGTELQESYPNAKRHSVWRTLRRTNQEIAVFVGTDCILNDSLAL